MRVIYGIKQATTGKPQYVKLNNQNAEGMVQYLKAHDIDELLFTFGEPQKTCLKCEADISDSAPHHTQCDNCFFNAK